MGSTARCISMSVVVALAGACSGDLFHATDWRSVCDSDPAARGCAEASTGSGGDGGATTSTASTSSAGGSATGGAGSGGGGGGAGGTGGGTGGACSTCGEIAQALIAGDPDPDTSNICPGESQAAFDAVIACICTTCAVECAEACQGMPATRACQNCALAGCNNEISNCQAS